MNIQYNNGEKKQCRFMAAGLRPNALILQITLLLLLMPVMLLCQGCSGSRQASVNFYAMDTVMQITCYGKDADAAVEAAQAEIVRLDELLSIGNESSEVSRINQNSGGMPGDDVAALADYALMLNRLTDGAYDMTILPIMELWGFTTGEYAVPGEDELAKALALCGSDLVTYNEVSYNTGLEENGNKKYQLELSDGQGIDFGGLAKGYTSDRLVQIFDGYDVKSAYFSLGGNVYCYHRKTDGSDWNIAIENPLKNFDYNRGNDAGGEGAGESTEGVSGGAFDYLGAVRVHDKAVVTSGAYERYFERDGKRYHHIINPATGYPAESGLISVTVVSTDGTLADGLSTACYVLGLDDSMALWQKYGNGGTFGGEEIAPFDLIMMIEDGDVYVTQGIAQSFSSEYDVHIIEREDKK